MALAYEVSEEQTVSITIKPKDNGIMLLDTIGKTMVNFSKLLKASADDTSPEYKWQVFLVGLSIAEDKTVRIDAAILPKKNTLASHPTPQGKDVK